MNDDGGKKIWWKKKEKERERDYRNAQAKKKLRKQKGEKSNVECLRYFSASLHFRALSNNEKYVCSDDSNLRADAWEGCCARN